MPAEPVNEERSQPSSSHQATLRVRGCGSFLLYASQPPTQVRVEGREVAVDYDPSLHTARFELPQGGSMEKHVEVRL